MATFPLVHGIDQLVLTQRLAFPRGVSHAHRVAAIVSALESRGLPVTRLPSPTSLIARLALPRLDLRIFPVGPSGPYVDAHAQAESLVRDPRATVAAMREALAIAGEAGQGRAAQPPFPLPAVRRLTLFADIVGWRLTPSTIRRFVPRRLPKPRLHLGGLDLAGLAFGKFFLCYDKTHEVAVHPSKAYILDLWASRGYIPEWGPVFRAEFTFDIRHFSSTAPDPTALWLYGLDRVRLTRRANGSTASDAQRYRFPLDPIWVALRGLMFSPLTATGEGLPPVEVTPATFERRVRVAVGRLRFDLAELAALLGVTEATAPDLAATVVRLVERRHTTFGVDLLAAIQRRAANGGASPAA